MKKPSVYAYFMGEFLLWLVICAIGYVTGDGFGLFMGFYFGGLVVFVIHITGMFITIRCGWVPWRDDDV